MWLSRIEGISLKKKLELLKYYGKAERIFATDRETLKKSKILTKDNIERILEYIDEKILNDEINELYRKNIKFISIKNEVYPSLLKEIYDPPLGLYVIGEMPEKDKKTVSVVGSRRCSEYGAANAYRFSKEMAENGITIVSGMAYGIDTCAHKGAIAAGGKTVAVLGCGVDVVYPKTNRELKSKIEANGCVISEYPPQTPPLAANFPVRNRIISGMSNATVVIEAGERSGTLITVGQALEQGRTIFSVPANITSEFSKGSNRLIKEGALVLLETSDILDELKIDKNNIIKENNTKIELSIAPEEKIVYDCIGLQPITAEEILLKTKNEVSNMQYILTMLELRGLIERLSGQKYIRSV